MELPSMPTRLTIEVKIGVGLTGDAGEKVQGGSRGFVVNIDS